MSVLSTAAVMIDYMESLNLLFVMSVVRLIFFRQIPRNIKIVISSVSDFLKR